jgi:hypothetical protein
MSWELKVLGMEVGVQAGIKRRTQAKNLCETQEAHTSWKSKVSRVGVRVHIRVEGLESTKGSPCGSQESQKCK